MAYLENYIAEKAEENRKLAAEKRTRLQKGKMPKRRMDVTEAEGDQGENSPEEDRSREKRQSRRERMTPIFRRPRRIPTETDLHNKIEDNGITNQEAGFEDGN